MSRQNECVRHARAGKSPREIAVLMGIKPGTVYAYLHAARRAGMTVPRYRSSGRPRSPRSIIISPRTLDAFQYQASLRLIPVKKLVERILEEIATSKLVAAVLDDDADVQFRASKRKVE